MINNTKEQNYDMKVLRSKLSKGNTPLIKIKDKNGVVVGGWLSSLLSLLWKLQL